MRPAQLRASVDDALRRFLKEATGPVSAISGDLEPFGAAIEAFVLDGGKRLRPAFCYWGFRAAGGSDDEPIVRAAASLELVQACALVHDDVIDGSDTRRGNPAVHRRFAAVHRDAGWRGDPDAFGAAAAILLGDLALVWADGMLTGSGLGADRIRAAAEIWDVMRVEVMCGQYLDVVEQARGGGSPERALRVARYKSAKYTVERPLHLGAVLAGGDEALLQALSDYGLPLGEAFQLRDDVLGVYGDPDETGKPAGDDLREGKRTVLVAFALEAADAGQRRALETMLGDPALDDGGVAMLRDVIATTGALQRVEQLIAERSERAALALRSPLIDSAAVTGLAELADAATRRDA